jgi:hypothetical protein
LSKPAADVVTQTPADMLELAGQPALSDFRLEKLAHALRKADGSVTGVEARYVYFVDVAAELSAEHRERLEGLLLSGEAPGRLSKGTVKLYVVGPARPPTSRVLATCSPCDGSSAASVMRSSSGGVLRRMRFCSCRGCCSTV